MAGPFTNTRGRGQRGGTTSTTPAARGAFRGTATPFRGAGNRGQARGTTRGRRGTNSFRARGNGTASTRSSMPATESPQPEATNSPFAQLNNKPSAPFGQPAAFQKSPFTGFGNASTLQPAAKPWQGKSSGKAAAPMTTPFASAGNGSNSTNYQERYDQLKIDRANQRHQAIKAGQMADPTQPTSLNKAITPVGTCDQMCPEFERVERIVQKMVDKCEKYLDPSTNSGETMEARMLKRFRRSAAGYDEQLPSDIRTPKALLQTTNYLIRSIIGGNEPLGIIHKFVWDRTRSVRNDFSVQQVTQESDVKTAVLCLERIARFHIVSLHLLSSPANEEQFDRHQEREQLNNTMLSLMYYYDDNRERIRFPNEDEFRAYYIIFSIHDQRPDLEARVQKWPAWLLNSGRVKVALELYAAACNTWEYQGTLDARRPNAIAQGFYARFFNIVDSPNVSYLMACVAEIYFSYVRQTAVRAIWKGYCRSPASQQHKNDEWTVDQLTQVLRFDDDDQTLQFCEENDLQLSENAEGQLYLNWGTRPVDSIGFSPSSDHSFSETYVESKRTGRTLVAVILGMDVREAAVLGMIDQSSLPERMQQSSPVMSGEPDSLFVSDANNSIPAPIVEINPSTLSDAESSSAIFPPPSTAPSANSGLVNPSASSQPPNPFGAPPQPSNPFQPPQASNPFASMFSKPSDTGSDNGAKPTPSNLFSSPSADTNNGAEVASSAPNPFSNPAKKAPDNATKGPEPTQNLFGPDDSAASDSSGPSSSLFSPKPSWSGTSVSDQPKPQQPLPSFFTPSQPFMKSGLSTTEAAPPSSKPNPFAASLSSFASPKPQEADNTGSQQPASTPGASNPLFASGNSLFPSAATKSSGVTEPPVSKPSTFSIFQNSTPSDSPASPFKFPTAPAVSSEKSDPSPLFPAKPVQSLDKSQSAPNLFASAPTSSLGAASSPPANSLFNNSKTSETQATPQETQPTPPIQSPFSAPPTPKPAPKPDVKSSEHVSSQGPSPALSPAGLGTAQTQLGQSTHSLGSSVSSTDLSKSSIKRKFEDGPTEYETEEERRAAWKSLLRRVAERQAREKQQRAEEEKEKQDAERQRIEKENNRKRVRDEQPDESNTKLLKVSDLADPPTPPKYSLAKSLMKGIPTLPILDRVKALTDRKPPTEAELKAEEEAKTARQRQIDEDELLFSAARIAAEQLRTGPKIFDPVDASDPRRYSYSPNSTFSAFTPYAKSASPPVGPHHGYKVAFAPDTPLGLGRTMSRTEQRIRSTGGHGLAYKPLDFTASNKEKRESLFRRSR